MTGSNPLKNTNSEPMELNEEMARKWLASALHYGHPEAAKKWREYLSQFETNRRLGA